MQSGTAVTLSCVLAGISAEASVTWRKGGSYNVFNLPGFTVTQGSYASNAQTSTLTLTPAINTQDTEFDCDVVLAGGDGSWHSSTLSLDVFSTFKMQN